MCSTLSFHSLPFSVLPGKPKIYQGFSIPTETPKTLENQGKLPNNQVMLGRDCLRALFRKQFPPPLNWVKSGLSRKSRHGLSPKWVKSGFRPTFHPLVHTQNPLLDPFQAIDKNPILNPLYVEINCSPKTGPEAALTQHKFRVFQRPLTLTLGLVRWSIVKSTIRGGRKRSLKRSRAEQVSDQNR